MQQRLVCYSVYAGGAALAEQSLPDVVTAAFAPPLGIAVQAVMLIGLVALVRVDWTAILSGRRAPAAPRCGPARQRPSRARSMRSRPGRGSPRR